MEQQFYDLLIELNQDTHNECFNSLDDCNTLTEKYICSTSCKKPDWNFTPYTFYITHTPYHTKRISETHLEIDFQMTQELHLIY